MVFQEVLPLVNPIHPKASSNSRDMVLSERGTGLCCSELQEVLPLVNPIHPKGLPNPGSREVGRVEVSRRYFSKRTYHST